MARRPYHDVPTALHAGDVRWTLDPDGDIGLTLHHALHGMPVYLTERDLVDMLHAIWVAKAGKAAVIQKALYPEAEI